MLKPIVHTQNIDLNQSVLVCPQCKGSLVTKCEQYNCSSCNQPYPIIEKGIAALFDKPEQAIARAYIQFHYRANWWRNQSETLADTLKSSNRKKILLPTLKAQNVNRAIFEDWRGRLEGYVKPAALLDLKPAQPAAGYGYNFNYLVRDWTNEASSGMEVEKIRRGIKRCLRLTSTRGQACVMGMGTGRFGLELAEYFKNIWGVDASFGQLVQYHDLLEKNIEFWRVNSKNQIDPRNIARKTVASIPDRLKNRAASIQYIWADALNAPFKNKFFDWVISIYFSDVKPLPNLLKEVKRILRPGGFFLHYGPLEYHFNDIEHHYTLHEFKDYFIKNGFDIVHESTCYPSNIDLSETSLALKREYIDKVLLFRFK